MVTPRTLAAVWAAKLAAAASQRLGRGGGTAVAGLAALRIAPDLIEALATQLARGSAVVTGTNGKTTTSKLLTAAVREAGLDVLANASGSNLVRGLASTLALAAGPTGRIGRNRVGVFEVDEATLPLVLPALRPSVTVFTNLFRDQLDRYGEVEAVAALWRAALAASTTATRLVLDADDPSVAALGEGRADVVYFGVDDASLDRGATEHAADALVCSCGARYTYECVYYGHVGVWRCPSCGRARPAPSVVAEAIDLRDGRSLRFRLRLPAGAYDIEMSLGGLYNVYNALAAAAAGVALGLPDAAIVRALQGTDAAFGRQEAFNIDGRRVELFLAKNPAGLNQVLSTLLLDPARRVALLVLNDGIADGRDISWVWDADLEVAAGRFERVVVAGTRAEELALRLKYAEWEEATLQVERELVPALERALGATPAGETLTIVATYTAMLALRDLLARRVGAGAFWQETPRVPAT